MDKLFLKQEDMLEHVNKAFSNYEKTPTERRKVSYIESRLEILEKLLENFYKTHSDICESISREQKSTLPYFTEDIYFQFEDTYIDYKTNLKDDLRTYSVTTSSSQITQHDVSISSSSKVKLPQIQLPKFSGLYEEWQTFYDMFTSLIHQNTALSGVQKLHYLKSSLTGEPETLLKNFSTTDTNYEDAFNQLTRRYNNKRYNCNEIMKRLFSQRNATDSASSIKYLLDITSSSLKSLENMCINTSSWDVIVNYLVVSRLDQESRNLWESQVSQLETDELPTWNQLVKFLETRFRTFEMINDNRPTTKSHNTHINTRPNVFHSTTLENKQSNIICTMCKSQHLLYQCKQFGKQSPEERSEFVQSKRLCFNCLAPTHSVKNCRSSACCHRCGRRHHTLLHFERAKLQDSTAIESTRDERVAKYTPNLEPSNNSENNVVAHLVTQRNEREVLLATAVVKAYSTNGYLQVVRVLIDPCSEGSFITQSTAQSLGLNGVSINGLVSGIGDGKTRSRNMVSLSVESIHKPKYSMTFDAYVLSKLTSFLLTCQTKISDWLDIERVKLADPGYGSPSKIDIILGVEVYEEIILPGFMKHPSGKGPIAQETQLGWILSGRVRHEPTSTNIKVMNFHIQIRDNELLKQYRKIEREPGAILDTKEEIRDEEELKIFELNTMRDSEGNYVVRDFKSISIEGRSREITLRRFDESLQLTEMIGTKCKDKLPIARLYNPTDWTALVIVSSRLFIQTLWTPRLHSNLTSEITRACCSFKDNLSNVKNVVILRWFNFVALLTVTYISQAAYAPAINIKNRYELINTHDNTVTGKTRVLNSEFENSVPKKGNVLRLDVRTALLTSQLIFGAINYLQLKYWIKRAREREKYYCQIFNRFSAD